MGRWLEISCFLLFLFYFSSQDSVYGNKIDMVQGDAAPLDVPTDAKADIVFLVHMSKKSTKADQNLLKIFMRKLLSSADIDSGAVRVAIVTYNVNSKVVSNFDTYTSKADVFNTIDNMNKFKGPKANAAAGLKMVLNKISINKSGDRPNVKNTLIMVTDQKSNKVQNSKRNADKLRGKGTEIFTVGVGFDTSAELNEIANHPAGVHAQFVEDFSKLNEANDLLLQSIPSFNVMKKPVPRSTNRPAPVDNTIYQTTTSSVVTRPTGRPVPTVRTPPEPTHTAPKYAFQKFGDCSDAQLDLVFVLDSSTSVGRANFRILLSFVKSLLSDVPINNEGVQVGILSFSNDVRIHFRLNDYNNKEELLAAIDSIPFRHGSANLAEAIRIMHEDMFHGRNGDRENVANIAVIITDGLSNLNSYRLPNAVRNAKNKEIKMYAIGIGLTDTRELDLIATHPILKNRITVPKFGQLLDIKSTLLKNLCPVIIPEAPPQGVQKTIPTDLIFLVDSSTSVGQRNFQKFIDYIKSFVSEADIDYGSVRIGLALYSTRAYIQFYLNDFLSKSEMLDAIDNIRYRYGSTNAAHMFRTLRNKMFTPENGDRPDARNIAIVITDGISNIEHYQTVPQARLTHAANIHVYAIGFKLYDTRELIQMCSSPAKENAFTVESLDEIEFLKDKILEKIAPATTEPPTEPTVPTTTPTTTVATTTPTTTVTTTIPTTTAEYIAVPSDIVFMVDSSTSVSRQNFKKVLGFIKHFLADADIENDVVHVGIATYSTNVFIQFNLNAYTTKEEIFNAIDNIPYRYGSTNIAHAFRTMRTRMFTPENGDRPEARNIAFLITDGVSNIEHYQTIPQAELAHDANIHVYAIGIGLYDTKELEGLSSKPSQENTFILQDFNELDFLKNDLFEKIYPEIPTTPPTTPVPTTEPPTTPPEPEFAPSDIIFLLDTSTSVNEGNFKKVLAFVKDFLAEAHFGPDGIRIGIVTYSTSINVQFYLNTYETKEEILEAIDNIPYTYGSTNTAGGLETIRKVMFQKERGDREDAKNIAIVVTDGVSNVNAYRTVDEAALVKKENIHIYAIGVGLVELSELHQIVSEPPEENTFLAQNFDELQGLKELVFTEFQPKPTTTPVITTTECIAASYDLAFLLDSSTSVSERNFKRVLTFVKEFLSTAVIGPDAIHVSIVTFSTHVRIEFLLNRYTSKEEIFEAIDRIPYRYGSTNTADGLKTIRSEIFRIESGDRPEAQNRLFVITDGVSNINSFRTIDEAELTKNQDIHIYAIGIGLPDTNELMKIASEPSEENTLIVREFNDLKGLQAEMFKEICLGMPTRKPRPTEPPTRPPVSVRGRCRAAKADIVFVLDSSTSVSQINFKNIQKFMKEFLTDATISLEAVRVGAIVYSTSVNIQFHLSDYSNKEDVFRAIDSIQYTYGSTNTADALKVMRTEMFAAENGDREDVQNIAVVVTDGVSNINSYNTVTEAELAKNDGIHIYAIGVGLSDSRELNRIASHPATENTFEVQDFDELHGVRTKVFKEFCPESCISTSTDIIFLMDTSTSVEQRNFKKMVAFIKDLLSNATIDAGVVRVGVATFSTQSHIEFHLNEYFTKNEIFTALDKIRYRYGNTNTAGALHTMRARMFTPEHGDRESAIDVAILITDGISNMNTNRISIEAKAAHKRGIQVYAIGIGLAEISELKQSASQPSEDYTFNVQDFHELQNLKGKLFEFCDLGR